MKRRDFLKGAAAFLSAGFGFIFGSKAVKAAASAQPVAPAAAAPAVVAAGYGSGVRAQVFEVIVRQAYAGAPWKEICAGPMRVNNISQEQVLAELARRCASTCDPADENCKCMKCVSERWDSWHDRVAKRRDELA